MATPSPRSLGPLAAAIALSLCPAAAAAEDAKPAPPVWETAPATRRSGFTVGLAPGFGIASIVGYPNDAKKIGYQRYYTATGARPALSGELWIGGALTDWFTFGIGVTGSQLFALADKATAAGIVFHLEGFPLFWMGGRLRDVGIMLDVGTGTASVSSGPNDDKLVDGSAASLIGGGVFYEGFRFWRVGTGPFLMGNYLWSDTVRRSAIFAGYRVALYTGP